MACKKCDEKRKAQDEQKSLLRTKILVASQLHVDRLIAMNDMAGIRGLFNDLTAAAVRGKTVPELQGIADRIALGYGVVESE